MSSCRSCGAEILWAITEHGNRMPIDAEPTSGGTVKLTDGPDPVAIVLSRQDAADRIAESGVLLHHSHFSTCPKADAHRRRIDEQRKTGGRH